VNRVTTQLTKNLINCEYFIKDISSPLVGLILPLHETNSWKVQTLPYAYSARGDEFRLTGLGFLAEGLKVITVRIIDTGRRSLLSGV
jgi:hypothetical protein